MKPKSLVRLLLSAALLSAALVGLTPGAGAYVPPPPPTYTDPNVAEMEDLLSHLQQVEVINEMYLALFGPVDYFTNREDTIQYVISVVNDELISPTASNLWDVRGLIQVAQINLIVLYFPDTPPAMQGAYDGLGVCLYWVDYEIGQPGVVVPGAGTDSARGLGTRRRDMEESY